MSSLDQLIEDDISEFVQVHNFRGYRGNRQVKRAGVQIEWTPELVLEYQKCANDCIYFIGKYMKIVNVDQGLIPFILRDYQREIIESMLTNRYTIMCTARQAGKSISFIGYITWYVLFHDHVLVAVLANKADTARELHGRLRLAYMNLPIWLQQGVLEGGWSKGNLELENGSRVVAESTSAESIRGYSVNLLILDECAHVRNWEDFSTAVMPTIVSGETTKIVQVSTPWGLNHFYKTWMMANKPHNDPEWNGYNAIHVPWTKVPGRDEAWKKRALQSLNFDLEKFSQEYECEFQGSSGTLIAGWKLKELVNKTPLNSVVGGLNQYEFPIKGHNYAITVDVSEGKGLNYSVAQISDITEMPYKQVATYRSNIVPPYEFAEIIYNAAKQYNNAIVLVEFESLGPEVASTLHNDFEYENIISTQGAGAKGRVIAQGGSKASEMGLVMSKTVKKTGCSLLKLLVEQNQYVINDFHTIEELSRFARDKDTYRAEPGYNDDCVMPLVIFAWMSNQQYFKDLTNLQTLARLRDRTEEQMQEQLLGIVGVVADGEDADPNEIGKSEFSSWMADDYMDDDPYAPGRGLPKYRHSFRLTYK